MKPQLCLAVSVLLNGVLALSLLHHSEPLAEPPAPLAAPPAPAPRPEGSHPLSSAAEEKPFHWSQVESEDYPTFRDNLLAVGCPRETVRDIIAAELRQPHSGVMEAAQAIPYWAAGEDAVRRRGARRRESEVEVRRLLAAWGLPLPELEPADDPGELRTEFLPAGKQALLAQIEAHYQRQIDARDAGKGRRGGSSEIDYLAQLDDERAAAIRAALTPAEFFEYQLRNSPIAEDLRASTGSFQPTESEFRAIFRITQQAEEQAGGEAWKQAQLRAALGPPRAEAFVRSQDPFYQDVYAFVSDEGATGAGATPDAARRLAENIYATRQNFERELAALGRGSLADEPAKAASLKALRDRTRTQLAQQLGPVAEQYFRTAGFWLE